MGRFYLFGAEMGPHFTKSVLYCMQEGKPLIIEEVEDQGTELTLELTPNDS